MSKAIGIRTDHRMSVDGVQWAAARGRKGSDVVIPFAMAGKAEICQLNVRESVYGAVRQLGMLCANDTEM